MFEKITPEQAGISSENIKKYIEILEENRFSTHNLIIARGNNICFEKYWEPFHEDYLHRMYSITKSFVSLAVGFLEQDGFISLDDKIAKYFPEEMKAQKDENFKNQTIRDMLKMSTAKPGKDWFPAKPADRVKFYFENDRVETRPSGTIFQYDSTGSFVLGAMVERITGLTFLDYLRKKCLDEIGFSKEAYCLKCPGGHSWGDSALICTPRDLLKVARFVLNGGNWNGKQLLNREYAKSATSKQIDSNNLGLNDYATRGYGYLFRLSYQNSFLFNGMGCQIAVCVPDKDLILIYNGDNQGKDFAHKVIIDSFFKLIVDKAADAPLEEDVNSQKKLCGFTNNLKLAAAIGEKNSEWMEKVNGVTYTLSENPMGITKFTLEFGEDEGVFHYVNDQGEKSIVFGMCENKFGEFPQEGYSDEIGTVFAPGNFYKCAASAAWVMPNQLFIKVQIIDKYFGNLNIMIGFTDGKAGLFINKAAEDFLDEYEGYACGLEATI